MKRIDVKDERGFILILALVTMVAMTIIGLSLIMNITVDMQLSRNERESKQAFQLADGGINEAIARLALSSTQARYIGEVAGGETGFNPPDRTTAWNSDDSHNFGMDYGGDRKSADNLNYEVTIAYLDETNSEGFCDSNDVTPNVTSPPASCDNDPAEVVMYGQDFNVPASLTEISYGNQPVYKITSTGTSGTTSRTIEAYIGASSLNTDTEGAINTNGCITVSGGPSIDISGGIKEGGGACSSCGGILPCAAKAYDEMDTYLGEDLSSIINMADERHQCLDSASCSDPGDDIPSSGMIDGVVTDWGDFTGDGWSTMIYINNAGGKDAQISGNLQGRGILIVSGNLELTGGLEYEGLVYVKGTLTISGGGNGLNVTGGVMANETVTINGSIKVTYDPDTLDAVAKENSSSAMMIWKRL
jgi:Tfp pilus assembly protein PilX